MALRLTTNIPVETRLLALEGEPAPSSFGGDQIKFRTMSGDLYVSEAVGAILQKAIVEQGVQAGEPVTIAKREMPLGNGRKGIRWQLVRGDGLGEQPDGTYAVPAVPEPAAPVPPVKPPAVPPAPRAAWAEMLLAQTNALTDVYAAALAHASAAHGNAVKPETIQSLLVTAFINLAKGASTRAA